MPRQITRSGFVAAAVAAAVLPGSALAAAPDLDLAFLRLLVGGELLAIDFYGRAATRLNGLAQVRARQALADERAHYAALAQLLAQNGGGAAATAGDIDFAYPKAPLPALALRIERLLAGAYVGAAATVQTPALRLAVSQIAANEAQHAAVWAELEGRGPIGTAFAPSLTLEAASDELGAFES
jgi:hypothetical protein